MQFKSDEMKQFQLYRRNPQFHLLLFAADSFGYQETLKLGSVAPKQDSGSIEHKVEGNGRTVLFLQVKWKVIKTIPSSFRYLFTQVFAKGE